jgi:hypothetical protein
MTIKVPSFSCCFLVESARRVVRTPLTLPHLQQLILAGELGPDTPVSDGDDTPSKPLKHWPQLVPFQALRGKIVRLFHGRRNDEAMTWAERFHAFDATQNEPDRQHVRLIEALIREKQDPRAAEDIYLSLLNSRGHTLLPVVYNNLGVLLCRTHRLAGALDYFERACQSAPPLLPALLNYRALLEHIAKAPRVGDHTEGEKFITRLHDTLVSLKARIESVRHDVATLDQLTERLPLPEAECATLLSPEELPGVFEYPSTTHEQKDLAFRCLQSARRALAERRWEETAVWITQASSADPADPLLELEKRSLLAKACAGHEAEVRRVAISGCEAALERMAQLEGRGEFQQALDVAAQLESQLADDEFLKKDQALHAELRRVQQRLARGLAQAHLERGRTLVSMDPAQALQELELAAKHDDFRAEALVLAALLKAPQIEAQFFNALQAHDFDRARRLARDYAGLSDVSEFQERAVAMADEAARAEADHDLAQAEAALAGNNVGEARRLAIHARTCHERAAAPAETVLTHIGELAGQQLAQAALALAAQQKAKAALDLLCGGTDEQLASEAVRRVMEQLIRLSHIEVNQAVVDRLRQAEIAARQGGEEFDRAWKLLQDALDLDPDYTLILEDQARVKLWEELFTARRALAHARFGEAVGVLLPRILGHGEARALLVEVAQRELERLLEAPPRRKEILAWFAQGLELLSQLKEREGVALIDQAEEGVEKCQAIQLLLDRLFAEEIVKIEAVTTALQAENWTQAAALLAQIEAQAVGRPLPGRLLRQLQALRREVNRRRPSVPVPVQVPVAPPPPRRRSLLGRFSQWFNRNKAD